LGRFAPELLATEFALEMWNLFEQGELTAEHQLTGVFKRDESAVDASEVLVTIEDARQEAILRALGREST
jgi:RIO kinase 1